MKKYIAPELQIVNIQARSLFMASINSATTNEETLDVGIKTGTGGGTPSQLTREQSGFGGGLWSDMQ